MMWKRRYLEEAKRDLKKLTSLEKGMVLKILRRVSINPLPANEGGYGKPLGNKNGNDLSGFCKIKLKKMGIRIVYKPIVSEGEMLIIIVGVRSDGKVYESAGKRITKYGLDG